MRPPFLPKSPAMVARDGQMLVAQIDSDYGGVRKQRRVDQVVVNHGTRPLDDLYLELKARWIMAS